VRERPPEIGGQCPRQLTPLMSGPRETNFLAENPSESKLGFPKPGFSIFFLVAANIKKKIRMSRFFVQMSWVRSFIKKIRSRKPCLRGGDSCNNAE
jgi:hypothetical protein